MRRRRFLQGAAASALTHVPAHALVAQRRRRPNLLYVFDDQHRAASLPGEPHCPVIAPNLEAFRRQNFSMDTCVSNYPLCTPHRGILLTGRWPYQTGLWRNDLPIRPDEVSLGRVFKDAGYRTAYVGKWHLQKGNDFIPAGPDRQGFDDWRVWVRTDDHYTAVTYDPESGEPQQPEGWQPVRMTDQAIEIMRRQPADAPWMMVVSYNPPHHPYDPPQELARRYPLAAIPLRPNTALPLQGQAVKGKAEALTSEEALRRATQGYYGAITGIDEQFGRLLKALDETGQAEDTIVVFSSDHGDMMGSQGRMAKGVPYEESCRVPFIVRYPGVVRSRSASDVLFGSTDIYPTLCGLAGLPVPRHCVGRDLSGVMRGEALADPPRHVFLMNQQFASHPPGTSEDVETRGRLEANPTFRHVNLPNYRGIRTDTHTYAVADSGRWLLFDNRADPYQMNNLVGDPAERQRMDGFDRLIMAWLEGSGDPFPFAGNVARVSSFPSGGSRMAAPGAPIGAAVGRSNAP